MSALLTSIVGLSEEASDLLTTVESFRMRVEPLVQPVMNWEKEVFSQVTPYRGTSRVWTFTTDPMPAATAENLVKVLSEAGKKALSGPLVGGSAVQVHVLGARTNVARSPWERSITYEMQETLKLGGDWTEYLRVFVKNAAGNFIDQTRWFVSGSGHSNLEELADSASLTFLRESSEGTLNPEIQGPDGPFALARDVRLQFARVEAGQVLQASDWWWLYAGTMRRYEVGGNAPFMRWETRDLATHLINHQISGIKRYGNAQGTATALQVLQGMLDNEVPELGYTIAQLGTISQGYNLFDQAEVTLDRGMLEVVKLYAGVLKMLLNASGDPVLTTWIPNREQTVPDQTFQEGDYYELERVGRTLDGIRNQWEVRFALDAEGKAQPGIISTAVDSDDPRPRRGIIDATRNPLVTTAQGAGQLGTLALQDTANSPLTHRARLPIVPIGLTELLEFEANNVHYSVNQKAATVSKNWALGPNGGHQTVEGAARPRGSIARWSQEENWRWQRGIVVPDDLTVTLDPDDIAAFFTIPTAAAHYTDEGAAATSFGKFGSTTPVPLRLNNLFRKITEPEKAAGITLYACVWHPNRSEDLIDWTNVKGRFNRLGSGGISFAAAPDPAGIVASDGAVPFLEISTETQEPLDGGNPLPWVSPDSWEHEDVIVVGTVEAGKAPATWFRLIVEPGATGQVTDEAWLYAQFTPAE